MDRLCSATSAELQVQSNGEVRTSCPSPHLSVLETSRLMDQREASSRVPQFLRLHSNGKHRYGLQGWILSEPNGSDQANSLDTVGFGRSWGVRAGEAGHLQMMDIFLFGTFHSSVLSKRTGTISRVLTNMETWHLKQTLVFPPRSLNSAPQTVHSRLSISLPHTGQTCSAFKSTDESK